MDTQPTPTNTADARKPAVKYLVVCGVTTTDDSWYFGNFVGICRALQRVGITGEFWNSFPVQEYFQQEKENIKFGRTNKHDWTPINIYTEREWRMSKPFWTQYAADKHADMVPDVMQYLANASVNLVEDDQLTVVLCGDGSEDGTRLGSEILTDSEMVSAFQKLIPGVQVNVVVPTYQSDISIDIRNQKLPLLPPSTSAENISYPNDQSFKSRLRNSPFSNPSSPTLGIVFNPHSTTWTHVARESKDSPNDQTNKATSQSYTESKLYTTFTNILHAEFIDRNFHSAAGARRILTPDVGFHASA